jgi:hypothetical protein
MIYFPLRPGVFAGDNPGLHFRSGYLVSLLKRIET